MSKIIVRKSKVEGWRERVLAQGRSGQTIREFCGEHQINIHTFCYWKSKFCKHGREGLNISSVPSRFIPISRTNDLFSSFPRIHLPNGVRIELGESLGSVCVSELILSLCGVGHPPKGGDRAKP